MGVGIVGRNCEEFVGCGSSAIVSASLDILRRFFLRKEPLFLLGMVGPEVFIAAIYVLVALCVTLGPVDGVG